MALPVAPTFGGPLSDSPPVPPLISSSHTGSPSAHFKLVPTVQDDSAVESELTKILLQVENERMDKLVAEQLSEIPPGSPRGVPRRRAAPNSSRSRRRRPIRTTALTAGLLLGGAGASMTPRPASFAQPAHHQPVVRRAPPPQAAFYGDPAVSASITTPITPPCRQPEPPRPPFAGLRACVGQPRRGGLSTLLTAPSRSLIGP